MNLEPQIEQPESDPWTEKVLAGMKLAVAKVYAEARRDDAEVVIMRDGKVVWIKARSLMVNDEL
jgi:hypothetical protein